MSDKQPLSVLFGSRVREARQRRGLTQGELATALGVDRTTVNVLENGRSADVRLSQLFAIALALSVSPLYFLVPPGGSETFEIAPGREMSGDDARAWILGAPVEGNPVEALLELPHDEQRRLLAALVLGIPPSQASQPLALAAGASLARALADEQLISDELPGLAAVEAMVESANRKTQRKTKAKGGQRHG